MRLDFGRVSLLLLPAAEQRRLTSGYPAQATISFDVITDDADDLAARLEAAGGTRLGAIEVWLGERA